MFLFTRIAYLDAPEVWSYVFQDPASPISQGIQDLHHDILFFMLVIMVFVFWMLGRTIWFFRESQNPRPSRIIHGSTLEVVWTVVPSIILLILAFPSFALLYSMDEVVHPAVTVKVMGNQWYWNYEYSDYSTTDEESINFDSYMIAEDELEDGQLRLLEVDNRVILPVDTHIRFLVSARDVIHCWSVPSLGVKCDGIPGRLNQTSTFITREGTFYGQCSEICGAHHGFMPICVESVSIDDYLSWVSSKLDNDNGIVDVPVNDETSIHVEVNSTLQSANESSSGESEVSSALDNGVVYVWYTDHELAQRAAVKQDYLRILNKLVGGRLDFLLVDNPIPKLDNDNDIVDVSTNDETPIHVEVNSTPQSVNQISPGDIGEIKRELTSIKKEIRGIREDLEADNFHDAKFLKTLSYAVIIVSALILVKLRFM
jgi:cytochrome c oxidase subunit 2